MEEKLREYRAKKRRQELIRNIKKFAIAMVVPLIRPAEKKDDHVIIETETNTIATLSKQKNEETSIYEDDSAEEVEQSNEESLAITPIAKQRTFLVYVTYLVYFLFWCTCYAIAIELGFGLVFITMSALCGIYLNTRTGPKKENEISAYSVFNKDFQAIDGTLNAEQFDREIRFFFIYA